MSLRQSITQRLEKDRLAVEEAARRYDVSEGYDVEARKSLLMLKRRAGPDLTQVIPAVVFGLLWTPFTWYVFLSSNDRNTWPGWILLWSMAGPAIIIFQVREAWRVWQGDVWTVDSEDGHIEHNGQLIATKEQIRYVHGWGSGGDSGDNYCLELVLWRGKPIRIGQTGSWEECSSIARRIADYAHLPVKLK